MPYYNHAGDTSRLTFPKRYCIHVDADGTKCRYYAVNRTSYCDDHMSDDPIVKYANEVKNRK